MRNKDRGGSGVLTLLSKVAHESPLLSSDV